MKKFYLILNDRALITDIANKMSDAGNYQFVGVSRDKTEVMKNYELILKADIVITTNRVPGFSLEEMMRFITAKSISFPQSKRLVKAVIGTGEKEIESIESALEIGYDVILNSEWTSKRIVSTLDQNIFLKLCDNVNYDTKRLWTDGIAIPHFNEALTTILHNAGIPACLGGYLYLKRAIELSFLNIETVVGGVTKIIYPTVAAMYNTTGSRVERSIRHAIESGWASGNSEELQKIFAYSYSMDSGKPTNGEFIANIADYLLVMFRKERREYLANTKTQPSNINGIMEIISEKNSKTKDLEYKGLEEEKELILS